MKKSILTVILSSGLFLVSLAQEKVTFKLNPIQGKVIPYEMHMKTDLEGPQNVIMDMQMNMSMIATQVTATEITYETKYSKIKTDLDAGLMIINYDSSREPENPMEEAFGAQMKPILDNTLTMTLDRQGKFLDMQFPNVPAEAFDKSSLQGLAISYPAHAVAIGESWESEVELPQVQAKGKTVNTYTEKTAEGYKITVKTNFVDASGNNIGSADGHYIIDPKTHFTTYSTATTNLEMQGAKVSTSLELKEIK